MPLPLGPALGIAIKYGAVAAVGALAMRASTQKQEHKNAAFEASFDQIDEGLKLYRTESKGETQFHAHHGRARHIWLGKHGLELDSRLLGRLRLRKLRR